MFALQVCRNINRIKICMETGRTVVLLNMESLYESLYDALNQVRVQSVSIRSEFRVSQSGQSSECLNQVRVQSVSFRSEFRVNQSGQSSE